ncbi:MAG TPA: Tim44-like domain-containing protein [Burkholderiaceae bacterium]|nr:Tim44-like domain-containing protein [Burkholderiaceae bacterium]
MKPGMKRVLAGMCVAVATLGVGLSSTDAQARRFGGGGSSGMQRSVPVRPAQPPRQPQQPPAQQQAVPAQNPAAAAAAQAAPRRSWLGPIAGIAAGIGLAALFSHFGLGAGLANFVTLLLFVLLGVALIRWLMRRMSPQPSPRYAGTGPSFRETPAFGGTAQGGSSSVPGSGANVTGAASSPGLQLPADFDHAGFERVAKMMFIRLQAANDSGDVDDIRRFTTPEVFAAARLELQARGNTRQQIDVVQLAAELLDFVREGGRDVVSVRFHGFLREAPEAPAEAFDEVWHVVRPSDGSGDWAIAGIQQATAT